LRILKATFLTHTIYPSNWGLTQHELETIPPSMARGFTKAGRGGFGSELPDNFGKLLMRGEYNSELYGPLQEEYLRGKESGTDVWIHKNRSALLGCIPQSTLVQSVTESIGQDERVVGLSERIGPISSREWHHNSLVRWCQRRSGIWLRAPSTN
jgi:hypothetical protein